jgi:hypothetical protein
MAQPYKSYMQQLLQNSLIRRRSYFSEHIDARLLVEQAQRNVRYHVRTILGKFFFHLFLFLNKIIISFSEVWETA